jgi:hypothetical protein
LRRANVMLEDTSIFAGTGERAEQRKRKIASRTANEA